MIRRSSRQRVDRKSTRLNSSHYSISYAVFCLKKKETRQQVSMAGRATFNFRGTSATPVIIGRAALDSGELSYRNVRYQLLFFLMTGEHPNQTSFPLEASFR